MGLADKFITGVWNVGIIDSGVEDVFKNPEKIKIRWVKHKYRDRFFADPFLQEQDDIYYYLLAEEYLLYEEKGKIVRLTVEKKSMKLVGREVVLNEKHHLSYPYILGEYIIPEGYISGATYAYKKIDNGNSFKRIKLLDEGLIDQTFLEYNGKCWIFATKAGSTQADAFSKLRIYYTDENGKFVSHKLDPAKDDIRKSRPGGMFFTYKGDLYRPAQDCEKRYGNLIRIMRIKKLTEDEFEEEEVAALSSRNSPPYSVRLHTFNVYDGLVVVDGYREYHSYLLKPIFLKCRRILLAINKKNINQGMKIIEG